MKIVILGLSITSSWGNGHATTYRALVRELHGRGHDVLFFERDAPWYAEHRDLPCPGFGRTVLYGTLEELERRHLRDLAAADAVIVGSYVPEGVALGEWVTRIARGVVAFYDIDTPITLRMLAAGDEEYISRRLAARYDLYLSFSGGPTLDVLRSRFGVRRPEALYCSVDPELHRPTPCAPTWALGYLGTYSLDRQPALEELLMGPARSLLRERMVVAGPQYPAGIAWGANVDRIEHLPPPEHARFYSAQRFTLNVTRRDMAEAGWSPSVRLFEAAASGTAIITDSWSGLEHFFAPGREILTARSGRDVVAHLTELPEIERRSIAAEARARVLASHTARHRAAELERCLTSVLAS